MIDKKSGVIAYKENNSYKETLVTGGNCKLQWKVDWAMRWSALGIDYEMNGKDLIPSFELSKKIANFIEKKVPVNMAYELFLDDKGEKISKSKGNGLTIDEWLKYGSENSLSLFMYNNPQRAKRLYFDCIPRNMDDYRKLFQKAQDQNNESKLENPLWHIHKKKIPEAVYPIDFSTLLNLVTALNTSNENTIKEFVQKYLKKQINQDTATELDNIIVYSIQYYKKFILPNIKKRKPEIYEKKALTELVNEIKKLDNEISSEDYQKIIYDIGKKFFPDDLKKWFISLYQILFGSNNGPRLGSFFNVYGKNKVLELLGGLIR